MFLVTAMHAEVLCVTCGSKDVIKYSNLEDSLKADYAPNQREDCRGVLRGGNSPDVESL